MKALVIVWMICLAACNATYTLDEYQSRVKIVNQMDAINEKLIMTDPFLEKARMLIQKEFLSNCDKKFDNADRWIMNAINATKGSLIEATYKKNSFDINKTKLFLTAAESNVQKAIKINFLCNAAKGDDSKVTNLLSFKKAVKETFPVLTKKTMMHLLSVLRENITKAFDQWVSVNSLNYDEQTGKFIQAIGTQLKTMFPLGDWISVAYKDNEYRKEYFKPSTFYHHSKVSKSWWSKWTVLMALSLDGEGHYELEGNQVVSQITNTDGRFDCKSETNSMLEEAKKSSDWKEFTYFGVISNAMVGRSRPELVINKDVRRGKCNYKVVVFT